ncbi:MAG: FHA domain-containing protein [Myxococcaceae bacterium]|nr:FHA domain-containing protein [Myxococcaceae bacterium]
MWQIVINGPGYFDTTYDLPEGITHLGRADENDIVLSGDLVSRRHARFKVTGDVLVIEDLGSRNGSRLNGEPLRGTAPLKHGDVIQVGENALAVRQPSTVEMAATEMVDIGAGGSVRRFGRGADIGGAVLISRDVRESVVLRALDNVVPFDRGGGTDAFAPFELAAKNVSYEWLLTLYQVAEKLSSARTLQEFLDETTDRVIERVNASTAVVLLRHPTGVMVPAAVRHRGRLARGEVPVSDAIIDAAIAKGAALAVADVRDDQRFRERESVILYGADQVLAIPFKTGETFAGVLYINRPSNTDDELNGLLDLCNAVANLIASGVMRFQQAAPAEDRIKRALERFLAPDLAGRKAQELAKLPSVAQLEERTCTMLFADIAGFTALVGKVPPSRITEMLTEFYQRMTGLVFSFEGTVDKFVGDSVVALFGAPYVRGDEALRAVRCALAMRADWEKAMNRFPPNQRCYLRIGLNTGKVLVGTVGAEPRLDFTALGEPVNIASWVAATATPGQILITGKTLAAVGARFDVTPLGERIIRPPKDRCALFEVLEEDVMHLTNPGIK